MGLFRRNVTAAALQGPTAQASYAGGIIAGNNGRADRARAMRIPTISRGRDLLCSLAASLPIHYYLEQWTGEEMERIPLPPEAWMRRPEARVVRAHTLAWTMDDLIFQGSAHWYVTARRAFDNRPSQFQRLPSNEVIISADYFIGNVPVGPYQLTWQGNILPAEDVVSFWSPIEALLNCAARSLLTAEKLDQAATRFASSPTAFGWLTTSGGEPLSGDDLAELAQTWADARDTNGVAALNQDVQWNESTMDPSRLQLVEGRQYQSLELARHINVPPYLVGAPTGSSMVYQNAEQARADLVTFGAAPFLDCIEQTLSSEQVTPRGHVVELSRDAWLRNPMDNNLPDPQNSPMEQPV